MQGLGAQPVRVVVGESVRVICIFVSFVIRVVCRSSFVVVRVSCGVPVKRAAPGVLLGC